MKPDQSLRPVSGVRYALQLSPEAAGETKCAAYQGFLYWPEGEAALELDVDSKTGAVHARLNEDSLSDALKAKSPELARMAAALVRSVTKSADVPPRKIVRWRPLT